MTKKQNKKPRNIHAEFLSGRMTVLRYAQLAQLGEHEVDIHGPIRESLEGLQDAHMQAINFAKFGLHEVGLSEQLLVRGQQYLAAALCKASPSQIRALQAIETPTAFLFAAAIVSVTKNNPSPRKSSTP
jgi:histidine ammonia-lyase